MTGFAGVNKKRWCTCAGQRRRNLVANMARLAHASNYYSTLAGEHSLAGGNKALVEAMLQFGNRIGFHFDGALCRSNKVCCGHRSVAWLG